MPFDFHIDPEVNCVFFRTTGPHSVDEVALVFDEILAHPDFRKGMNVLRDMRTQQVPPDTTFKTISDRAKQTHIYIDLDLGGCKLAIVVGDAVSYAKVHQFIVTGRLSQSPVERKPYRNLEDAKHWLGISEDYDIKYPMETT